MYIYKISCPNEIQEFLRLPIYILGVSRSTVVYNFRLDSSIFSILVNIAIEHTIFFGREHTNTHTNFFIRTSKRLNVSSIVLVYKSSAL